MNKNKSFTLIELLVVIVIIGILAGVIIISTSSSIDKANIAKIKIFEDTVKNSILMGLISEWKFDEGDGTVAKDSWGNNNGTLINGPMWKSGNDCVSGACLSCDGSDDYVYASGNPGITQNNSFTMAGWNKPLNVGNWQYILSFGETPRYGLWSSHYSYPGFYQRLNDGTYMEMYAQSNAVNNKWSYLVITYDVSIKTYKLYLDGVMQTPKVATSLAFYNAGSVFISGTSNGYYYKGLIDNVSIYNTALSSLQIKQNYVAGLDSLLSQGSISKEAYNQRINELAYE